MAIRRTVCGGTRRVMVTIFISTTEPRNLTLDLVATIHRLQISNPDNAINALRGRYLKISKIQEQLPAQETIEIPKQLSLKEVIDILPPGFLNSLPQKDPKGHDSQKSDGQGSEQNTIDERPFAFAFFGWDVVKDGSSGLLECRACFRRLGLWLYKPKEEGKEAIYEKLPVHSEHMDYCPWINGLAQSGTGPTDRPEDLLSGWQILAQGIRTKHRRRVKASASATPSENTAADPDTLSFDSADEASQRAKDREWWSKLRRVREALHVKGPKKTSPQGK
jgi:Rsm1-like